MAFEINFLTHNIALVHGVTDGSVNTELATLPPNPWGHTQVYATAEGPGVYIQDTNSDKPEQSGVTADNIDIRSTIASKTFKCLVIQLSSGEGFVRDHSAFTT